MPLKIIRTPDDPHNARRAVYAEPSSRTVDGKPRPRGRMGYDAANRRTIVLPPPAEPRFYLGLDLGQAADWTALAVVERNASGYSVPYLDRVRGLPYPHLAAKVADLLSNSPLAGASQLIVDATGVGRPVIDILRDASLSPIAVTIHGGAKVTGPRRAPRVPKRDLINVLLVVLQAGALQVSRELPHAATLARELAEMRCKVSAAGHDSYGVWRDGEHDDLVLALALAVWSAERRSGRLPLTLPPA